MEGIFQIWRFVAISGSSREQHRSNFQEQLAWSPQASRHAASKKCSAQAAIIAALKAVDVLSSNKTVQSIFKHGGQRVRVTAAKFMDIKYYEMFTSQQNDNIFRLCIVPGGYRT
jgi:hypothetical protein